MPKETASNFDKTALKDDLKMAGFEDYIADNIASRVDERKGKEWTYDMGRQEAIKEAQMLIDKSHNALDTFRARTLTTTGQQDHRQRERPLAEKIADRP